MKKYLCLYSVLSALVLTLFFGCTEKYGDTLDMTIVAKDNIGAKSHLSDGYVAWDNGDVININGQRCTVSLSESSNTATISGVTRAEDNQYRAVFPASITGNHVSGSSYGVINLPICQIYSPDGKVDIPMVAKSSSGETTLSFYNIAALMKITVEGTATVRSIVVSSTTYLSGKGRVGGTITTPQLNLTSGYNYVILDCGDEGVAVSGTKDFYVVVPAVTDAKFTITVNTASKSDEGEYIAYTRTQVGTATIHRSEMGSVPFPLANATQTTTGELFGKFSVDASGKQVRFSKGNLQYGVVGSGIWSFAETQSTTLGASNNPTGGIVDLFGWATGDNPTQASTNDEDYCNSNINSGSAYDWGHNAISNGGNIESKWTTLTKDEWDYLVNQRPGNRFILAQVDGRRGIILLPDDYQHPSNLSAMTHVNSVSDGWITHNEIRWGRMQAAGAVFLPLAGEREGSTVTESDNNHPFCYYWSLTRYSRYSAYGQKIASDGRGGVVQTNYTKHIGNPVRLVSIVNSVAIPDSDFDDGDLE